MFNRVEAVIAFVAENTARRVSSQDIYWLSKWYYENSLILVSSTHPLFLKYPPGKKISQKYGHVVKSAIDPHPPPNAALEPTIRKSSYQTSPTSYLSTAYKTSIAANLTSGTEVAPTTFDAIAARAGLEGYDDINAGLNEMLMRHKGLVQDFIMKRVGKADWGAGQDRDTRRSKSGASGPEKENKSWRDGGIKSPTKTAIMEGFMGGNGSGSGSRSPIKGMSGSFGAF